MELPFPRFSLYKEESHVKRLVFFCFCAAAALAIIPTGIASWEGGLSIESSFDFVQPVQPFLMELPGFAAPDPGELTEKNSSDEDGGRTETEEQQGAVPPGETGEKNTGTSTVDEGTSNDNPPADSTHNSGQSDLNSAASGNESGNAGSGPSNSGSSSSSESSSSGSSETSSGHAGTSSSSGSNETSGGADSSSSSSSGSSGDSGSSSSSSGSSSDSSSAD